MDPNDEDFDWMVARARGLIASGKARDAAVAAALGEGEDRAKRRGQQQERAVEPWRQPLLQVKLGEAAKWRLGKGAFGDE